MKLSLTITFLLSALISHAGYWTQKANFGGGIRVGAVGVAVNGKGYVGTGADSVSNNNYNDWWEYDPVSNNWTQKNSLPGIPRNTASVFEAGGKIYLVGGGGGMFTLLSDCWEYEPVSNTWTQKADFGGGTRNYAASFSVGGKGYIVVGQGGTIIDQKRDTWEFDPTANTWTQRADFGGVKRVMATGFSIGNRGYVTTGQSTGVAKKDLWEFNPVANTWNPKSDLTGPPRSGAVSFTIDCRAYVGTGASYPSGNDFWEYDPVTGSWTQIASVGLINRSNAVGFSIGTKGYIGIGGQNASNYLSDFWEYTPDPMNCLLGESEIAATPPMQVFPNPVTDHLYVSLGSEEPAEIFLYDVASVTVARQKFSKSVSLNMQHVEKGIYFYEIHNKNGVLKTGKIVKD